MNTDSAKLVPEKRRACCLTKTFFLFGIALLFSLSALWPAVGADTEAFSLQLKGGGPNSTPVELDLTATDGTFDSFAWASAYGYNLNQHTGTVAVTKSSGDRIRLSVKIVVQPDPIAPQNCADYDIALVRRGDALSGSFTGSFNDRPVTGEVSGAVGEPAIRRVQGHAPLKPGEHPRLIFRKSDLPELRRRMETPEGKAILSMMNERSPVRRASQVDDRRASWIAANWGVIHQLAGDADAAQRARRVLIDEVITKPMPRDRKDIHHATRLLGIALAYDLCYEAWDAGFRSLVAEYLRVSASELTSGFYEGFRMDEKRLNPTPWGHRNAIRMSCAGTAAMAILGDRDSEGRIIPDADRVARAAGRHVEQYLRLGVTRTGTGVEGSLRKDLALANGVLHFMHASAVALGRDFSRANPMLLAGNVLRTRKAGAEKFDSGLTSISIQASGLWPVGLGSVPAELRPVMKWCFDRDAGLLGKQHFGLAYPYQAAYALRNYPFGVAEKAPGEGLALLAAGTVNGHVLLRDRWEDSDDITAELYLNARGLPPIRAKNDDLAAGVMNLSGFGATWMRGFAGASRMNDTMPAGILYTQAEGKRLLAGMDLSGLYIYNPPERYAKWRPSRKFTVIQKYQWQRDAIQSFLNPETYVPVQTAGAKKSGTSGKETGPRVIRHVAVDMSGKCGAPVLVVIVERSSGDVPKRWRVPVPNAVAAPGGFTAGKSAGANVVGRIIVPGDAKLKAGRIEGRGEYFIVLTLQQGAAPAVAVEGTGLSAKLNVGGTPIAFDGKRIILGK